jgi:UrcA family protein
MAPEKALEVEPPMSRLFVGTLAVLGLVSTVCSGCSSVAPSSAAGYNAAAPQSVVSYSDLDLSRDTGAQVMLSRLQGAAMRVCGGSPDVRDLNAWNDYRACEKQAMDQAVTAVNSPMVAKLYEGSVPIAAEAGSRVANNN